MKIQVIVHIYFKHIINYYYLLVIMPALMIYYIFDFEVHM